MLFRRVTFATAISAIPKRSMQRSPTRSRHAANEGADPASAELHEAAVAPVGVSPVDLVATPPSTGAAPAPGGPLPGRWVLTDAEIRPIVLGVCLAMFVSALNQTIVATALPTIGRDFNDFENLSWLITAYLLTSTVAAPLFGKLSDIYGRRKVMLMALGIFTVGSIACALAPSMLLLILCRGLQGLGGGGIVPLVQATVADAVAPRERGRYQAYIGTVWIAAGTAGPVAGGYVADHLHWSLVFWLNVPLGLAAAFMIYRNLARLPRHERKHKLDLIGALLMMTAAILLLLVLTWGGGRFAWTSPQIIGLLIGSALLWLAFTCRLTHTDEPFLPLAVLANPVVRAGTLAASFAVGSQIGLTIYMPLYYENVYGLSASNAGWALIPIAVMTTPGSVLSGQVMVRFRRYKWLPIIGLSVAALTHIFLACWPTAPLVARDYGAVRDRHRRRDRVLGRDGEHPKCRFAVSGRRGDRRDEFLSRPVLGAGGRGDGSNRARVRGRRGARGRRARRRGRGRHRSRRRVPVGVCLRGRVPGAFADRTSHHGGASATRSQRDADRATDMTMTA